MVLSLKCLHFFDESTMMIFPSCWFWKDVKYFIEKFFAAKSIWWGVGGSRRNVIVA